MAFFRIEEPNQPPKYIKSVDGANETLEFTNSTDDAYYKDSGFFADSEYEFLMFHFKNSYPELQYMKIDTGWHTHEGVLNQVQEENGVAVGNIAMADVDDAAPVQEGNVWGGIDAVEEGPQEAPIGVANAEQFAAVYNGVGAADIAVGVNAAGG
jgi:hypothetical protein